MPGCSSSPTQIAGLLWPILYLAMLMACTAIAPANASDHQIVLDGFRIDISNLPKDQRQEEIATISKQLAFLYAARLPPEVFAFMRTVPLALDSNLDGNPAIYNQKSDGTGVVLIRPSILPADRPILLHELLHAFQLQRLSAWRTVINDYYHDAIRRGLYPDEIKGAHFLDDPQEYFAIVATIFLLGSIKQPPYNCSIVAHKQHALVEFLVDQFGPHDCM